MIVWILYFEKQKLFTRTVKWHWGVLISKSLCEMYLMFFDPIGEVMNDWLVFGEAWTFFKIHEEV